MENIQITMVKERYELTSKPITDEMYDLMLNSLRKYSNYLFFNEEPSISTIIKKYEMNLLDREILIYQSRIKRGKNFNEKRYIERLLSQNRKYSNRTGKTSQFKKEFRFIEHLAEVDPDKPINLERCYVV